jgi:hypothetical protein
MKRAVPFIVDIEMYIENGATHGNIMVSRSAYYRFVFSWKHLLSICHNLLGVTTRLTCSVAFSLAFCRSFGMQ